MGMIVTGAGQTQANAAMMLSGALDKNETLVARLQELLDQLENELLGLGLPDRNDKKPAELSPAGLIPMSSKRVLNLNAIISMCNDRLYHLCNELGVKPSPKNALKELERINETGSY